MNSGGKQRVIGALVLIAIGVLFIPLLLEKSEEQVIDTTTKIPPKPEFTLYEHKNPKKPDNTALPPSEENLFIAPVEDETVAANNTEGGLQSAASEPKLEPTPPAKDINNPNFESSGLPKTWVVQVASFTEQQRAATMVKTLLEADYRAYSRQVQSGNKKMYRVYVGPNIDRDDALATKSKLDKKLNANTLVLRLTP